MGISDLVETIANSHGRFDTFYFIMEDTNARQIDYAVNCYGKQVSACEYPSSKITSHYTQNSEDAIAFLFDADIHLWKLVSFEVSKGWYDYKQWTVRLMR